MKLRRFLLPAAIAGVLAAALWASGCSSKSNPMNPAPTAEVFDSGSLTAPATFSHVFHTLGAAAFHCNFHRTLGMVGTVNVVAGADSAVSDTASGTSFRPATLSVRPGGTVRWVILDGTHTVTSDATAAGAVGGGGGGGY